MRTQWLFVGIAGVIVGLSSACTMDVELVHTIEDGRIEGGGGSSSSSNAGGTGGSGGAGGSSSSSGSSGAKPFWENAPGMAEARLEHTMTQLQDGRILIAGGFTHPAVPIALESAEIWDSITNKFTLVAPMNSRRARHTATLLKNGNVVVTGGYNGSIETNSMEVYDPIANTWTLLPETMKVGRMYHAAVVLPNGTLLTASGCCDQAYGTAETTAVASTMPLFPLVVKTTKTPMSILHAGVTLTLLPDDRPLLVGNAKAPTTEWYNVTSDSWKFASNLNVARNAHSANLDASGLVVAGGVHLSNNVEMTLDSVERYDPQTNQWTLLSPMQHARRYHSGTLVTIHGQQDIVWVGGTGTGNGVLGSCERASAQPCGDLNIARTLHQALVVTVNDQKRLMVTGGVDASGAATNSVEWLSW